MNIIIAQMKSFIQTFSAGARAFKAGRPNLKVGGQRFYRF